MYRWAVLRKAGGPPSFPSDPLACSSPTLRGRFANLSTGGLSPGRIRIGNLCYQRAARAARRTRPDGQAIAADIQSLGWGAKHYNAFWPPMPAVRVFHRGQRYQSRTKLWPDHPRLEACCARAASGHAAAVAPSRVMRSRRFIDALQQASRSTQLRRHFTAKT